MAIFRMLIDGEWVDSKNQIEVEDPAKAEIFDQVPAACDSDIEKAVQAAHRAYPAWSRMSAESRGEILIRAASLAVQRADDIARLMTREQGKPLNEARGEVLKGAEILRYYAEEGKRIYGRIVPARAPMPPRRASSPTSRWASRWGSRRGTTRSSSWPGRSAPRSRRAAQSWPSRRP